MTERRSLTKNQRIGVLWASEGRCHICGEIINPVREAWEVEHVIALAAGGTDDPMNMRAAHIVCHEEKTRADRKTIAKVKRVKAKHEGTWERPKSARRISNPRLKRKIDGTVVDRETGQPAERVRT
jgi:hypothetical protein